MFAEPESERGGPPPAEATDTAFHVLTETIVDGQRSGVFVAAAPRELALASFAFVHGLAMLVIDGKLGAIPAARRHCRAHVAPEHVALQRGPADRVRWASLALGRGCRADLRGTDHGMVRGHMSGAVLHTRYMCRTLIRASPIRVNHLCRAGPAIAYWWVCGERGLSCVHF